MKKIYYTIAFALASLAAPAMAEQLVVTLDEPGTLEDQITAVERVRTTDLKVVGPMDGSDLLILRWMTGIDDLWQPTSGRLVNVDLSEAQILAGGEPFATALGSDPSNPIWVYSLDNTIQSYLFSGSNLESIVFPNSITSIRSGMCMTPKVTGTVTVPEGVLYLGEYAFESCGMEEIILPSTLTYQVGASGFASLNYEAIGAHAFESCTNLKKINIPAGVKYLKGETFKGCSSLESFTIPENIQSIGSHCFANSGLKDLYIDSKRIPTAAYEAFAGLNMEEVTLHVPEGRAWMYEQTEEWNQFVNIVEDPSLGLSAIDEISIDNEGSAQIYTIDGRAIRNANVGELPAGIYVINGKKVIR